MNSAHLEGVRRRAELYKQIEGTSRLDAPYGRGYGVSADQVTRRPDMAASDIKTVYSQASSYNSYEQSRTANDLHVQLMETKTRSLHDFTERRMVEMKLDQAVQENERLKQRILQLNGELQAAIRQCEELASYKDAKVIIEDAKYRISDLEQQLRDKDKQLEALHSKLIDQQNEFHVLTVDKDRRIEDLTVATKSQAAQLHSFELENVPGLHRRIEDQELELRSLKNHVTDFEISGKALKTDYEAILLTLAAEFNQLNAWVANNRTKLGNIDAEASSSVTFAPSAVDTSNMASSLRYGDLAPQSHQSPKVSNDIVIGHLSDALRQIYYQNGAPSGVGSLTKDDKLIREVCLHLGRVIDGVKQVCKAGTNLQSAYSAKSADLQAMSDRVESYEQQLASIKTQLAAKESEMAGLQHACLERDEKLSMQEAELTSLRVSQEELDAIKVASLKLVDQLSVPDSASANLMTTIGVSQTKTTTNSPMSTSMSTDTRIRYASAKGINVRSILSDACIALQEAQTAKQTTAMEIQSLQTRLATLSSDLSFQQSRCTELEQRNSDMIIAMKEDTTEQIKSMELELRRSADNYSAQIATLNDEVFQRQQKLSVFAFVIYALCKIIEMDRYSLRSLLLERRLLSEIASLHDKMVAELQKLNSDLEKKVYTTIVSLDPNTGLAVEQQNPQYLTVMKGRREVIKKRKRNALVHMVLFCSYLYSKDSCLLSGATGGILIKPKAMPVSQTMRTDSRDEFFAGLDKLFATLNRSTMIPTEFYGLSTSYSTLSNADAIQMDGTIKEKDLAAGNAGRTSILELMSLPNPPPVNCSYHQLEANAIFKLSDYLPTVFKDAFMYANLFSFTNRFCKAKVRVTSLADHYAASAMHNTAALLLNLRNPKSLVANLGICIKFQDTLLTETRISYQNIYHQLISSQHFINELENIKTAREHECEDLASRIQLMLVERSKLPTEEAYAALQAEIADLTSKLRDTTNMLNAERSRHNTFQQEYDHSIARMTQENQTLLEEKSRLAIELEELTLKLQRTSNSLDSLESKPVQAMSKASAKDLLNRMAGAGKLQRSLSAAVPAPKQHSVHFADSLSSNSNISTSMSERDLFMPNEAPAMRSTHDSICLADIDLVIEPTVLNPQMLPRPVQPLSHPPLPIPASQSQLRLDAPVDQNLASAPTSYSQIIEQYNANADADKPTEAEEIQILNRQCMQDMNEPLTLENFSTSRVDDMVKQLNVNEKTDRIFADSALHDANINQYINDLKYKS